ncbi:5'/3'-nucleotidase SurE [Ferruginivarius sediminum]|uniref:5'-nucleotidase SurE n=1 Tax=Ferruginivarius sediminum TaxID=2661937 RepID=A0A369T810_9PROT|nr:5'/3'-nucleotidase SurE [Ferruginivarius sediminum]RDD61469.1 5'/3'-nucleotidase SurE [Ferruginivarius sediminum]
MPECRPLDLSNARILVTNDDGVQAPGLDVLEGIARKLSDDVWVVAPETEQSATSHSLTVRRPLRLRQLEARRFSVDGTPTDCVVVAVSKVLADRKPDLVLSGINHGSNLGEDVIYSGTVAAAMEAALIGLPAIALSLARRGNHDFYWETAERHAPDIIRRVAEVGFAPDMLVNVNFPDLQPDEVRGARVCRQGRRDVETEVVEGVDPGGRPYIWIGDYMVDESLEPDTDLAAVNEGCIAVTPLHLDLTERRLLETLGAAFS